MKEYVLPVYGLKPGIHHYSFDLDQSFFDFFDSELFRKPQLEVELELEKTSNMIMLHFNASGDAEVMCDRCGDEMVIDIQCEEKVIVKYGEEKPAEMDEIIVLLPSEHELDISRRVYEMIALNMPSKSVHASIEDCNQEAIKRLSTAEEKKEDDTDPRWDALKNLKNLK